VGCDISLLAPKGLAFLQTDQYDPNPRPRITLREWHLTATTPEKSQAAEFVALYRPYRKGNDPPCTQNLKKVDGGYILTADLTDGQVVALLPTENSSKISAENFSTEGTVAVQRIGTDGSVVATMRLERKPIATVHGAQGK